MVSTLHRWTCKSSLILTDLQEDDCINFPSLNVLNSLEVASSVGGSGFSTAAADCVNLTSLQTLDSLTVNVTGTAHVAVRLTAMASAAAALDVDTSLSTLRIRINMDNWYNTESLWIWFADHGLGTIGIKTLEIFGTSYIFSGDSYHLGIKVNITSATTITTPSSCIIAPLLSSATSITMSGPDFPCLYDLSSLATVGTLSLQNVAVNEYTEKYRIALPNLTKVTESLTIGPSSSLVQSISVPSLVSISRALTIHGQTNVSDIVFSNLASLHSIIMYNNSQTVLPGDFGKLSDIQYIYLNGYIDPYVSPGA